jgi:hypothetical protein
MALVRSNAKLPAALLLAFELTGNSRYRSIGLNALGWLRDVMFNAEGELRLVGQNGWYRRGGVKAAFDEQCVDAQGLVEAAVMAERITHDERWRADALAALAWFVGRNVLQVALLDPVTGGCCDGITPHGVNVNMGAESIVCYVLAYLSLVEAGALTLDGALTQSRPPSG